MQHVTPGDWCICISSYLFENRHCSCFVRYDLQKCRKIEWTMCGDQQPCASTPASPLNNPTFEQGKLFVSVDDQQRAGIQTGWYQLPGWRSSGYLTETDLNPGPPQLIHFGLQGSQQSRLSRPVWTNNLAPPTSGRKA
ncbi:hypothetical protein NG895_28720 [Aeoliella sp. ICT_H6.2]|uniref:Uncharacterized protein n=1 Tax=Aeoliella straminimaris TaxID=2954799 RepID=A0A9X2JJR0_9BACT|nr:hypothetical protein [Aeoliella straminimaris]MCO6047907.1 hypothetical protein [Aeoliella straminimaris]